MTRIAIFTPTPGRETSGEELEVMLAFVDGILRHGETPKFYRHGDLHDEEFSVMFGWNKLRHNDIVNRQRIIGGRVLGINFGSLQRKLGYYTIGWDGLNNEGSYFNENSTAERWNKLGLTIEPWRVSGQHIILVCQVPTDGSVHQVDIIEWCKEKVEELKKFSDREIIFRPHPLARMVTPSLKGTVRSEKPFEEDLKNAWAVVSYSSTSSGLSVLSGIPALTFHPCSVAYPVSSHDIAEIESPKMPELKQWAYNLANTQWSLREIRDGSAWAVLKQGVLK